MTLPPIVAFSNDWGGDPLSKTHLLRRAARETRVLWVNSLGNRAPRPTARDARRLLARLRDPAFTSVLLVTLPEATPVHEAAALQNDLRRAGIEPRAWVINQSLLLSGTTDPILLARERSEHRYLDEVALQLAPRTAWLPWMVTEPTGPDALAALTLSAPPSGQSC